MTVAPIFEGLLLGKGCNSALGKTHGWAIDFGKPEVLEDATGQRIEAYLELITSSQELANKLNVSASASFKGFGFSLSAEVNFLSQQDVNSFNTYLLVSIKVKNPEKVISYPRLKPEAEKLLKEKGWEDFEKTYGLEYMSGVVTGGSYYGLIQIKTTSREEQQKIAAAVSFSGWGAEAKGKLDTELKTVVNGKEIRVTVLQSGGSGDPIEVSLEEMIEQVKKFPDLVKNAPVAYQGIFETYRDTVLLPPSVGGSSIDRQHQLDVLEELGQKYLWYKDYRSNLSYILDDHILDFKEYQSLSPENLQRKSDNFQKDFEGVSNQINDLIKRARKCRESTTACELPTEYYRLIEPLPKMEGQNQMLKKLEEEVAKLRQQVDALSSNSNVGEPDFLLGKLDGRNQGNKTANRALVHCDWGIGNDNLVINYEGDFEGGVHIQGSKTIFDGNVGIGTGNPAAKLDVNGEFRIKGNKPFQVRKYDLPSDNQQINTGYSDSDWVGIIAGFRALNGNINEVATNNIIQIYTYQQSGQWWIYADFLSHGVHERWEVWAMFIRRELVN